MNNRGTWGASPVRGSPTRESKKSGRGPAYMNKGFEEAMCSRTLQR